MNSLNTSYPRKYQDKTAKLKHKSAEGDEEFHKIMSEIAFVKTSPVPNRRVTLDLLKPPCSLSPPSLSPRSLSPRSLSPYSLSPPSLSPRCLSPRSLSPRRSRSPGPLIPNSESQHIVNNTHSLSTHANSSNSYQVPIRAIPIPVILVEVSYIFWNSTLAKFPN